MKTSDSESGQGFRLLIPGAVVVLMAVLGFKDLYSRFDSKRPPRPAATYPLTSPDELHAIRARLWEDPLEVVYGSSKSLPSQKTSSTSGQTEDTAQEPESSADDFEKSAFLLRNIVRTHCDQQTNEDGEVQA
jgi:hypothetical protein